MAAVAGATLTGPLTMVAVTGVLVPPEPVQVSE
jgi:hypothetical protein